MKPGEVTRNFYRDQGATLERNRIIGLLAEALGDMRPVDAHSIAIYDGLDFAIALIKGEK